MEGWEPVAHALTAAGPLKTRPKGQTEQDEDPADEKLLAGQGIHDVAFLNEKEFGGQRMQVVLATTEYVPAGQAAHACKDAAAAVGEYVPAGHCTQLLDDVIPGEVE